MFLLHFSRRSNVNNCHARLIKPINNANDENIQIRGEHIHAPDAREIEKKQTLTSIKNAAKIGRENARVLIASAVGNVTNATAAIMPTTKSMTRMVQRIRNKNRFPKNPRNLIELVLPNEFITTSKGDNFLLYDSGPNENRLLIFGTLSNLKFLSECNCIYMDGTFDVTPPLFKQVYTIHGINI